MMTLAKAMVCAVALCATGCGAEAPNEMATQTGVSPGEEPGAFPVAEGDEASGDVKIVNKAGSFFEIEFNSNWSRARNSVPTPVFFAAPDFVCILSTISGDFETSSYPVTNQVSISFEPAFPQPGWYGTGHGHAICAAWTRFLRGPGNWQNLLSPNIRVVHAPYSLSPATCIRNDGFPTTCACANLWQGDGFASISGIAGALEGGGEWAMVQQSPTGSGFNRIAASQATGLRLWAEGHAIFVGAPGIFRPALFWGRSAQGQVVKGFLKDLAVGTFSVSSSGTRTQLMVPSADALCGITRVTGDFNGTGESLSITETTSNNVKFWQLKAAAGNGRVSGSARCMSYTQL